MSLFLTCFLSFSLSLFHAPLIKVWNLYSMLLAGGEVQPLTYVGQKV